MQIIQNIKFQYHIKEINDLLSNDKYRELRAVLILMQNKNPNLFFKIINHFYHKLINIRSTENIFIDNLVLINSFISNDQKIVSEFFNYYLKQINYEEYAISDFPTKIAEMSKTIDISKKLSVNDIVNNSIIFQIMMVYKSPEILLFLNNEHIFFSTEQNFNFCHSGQVKCFFHIVDHPYNVYSYIKSMNGDDKDIAQNVMFNLDNSIQIHTQDDIKIEIVKKGWTLHTNSWCDPNVLNSMKGLTIKKEEFQSNPEETYASLILHLRQNGEEIPLDYNVIDQYVETRPSLPENTKTKELSNNEKKFIQKNCSDLNEDLLFDF